ncbi:MAG: hypothetical protein NTU44_10380, partial [Bacteroidetes bacterium]|nr:hypothetical protein [Bacteroidota bacterium]
MKNILFITCLLSSISAYCQSVSPSVTASSGGFVIGTTLTQSWTLGEAVVETFTAPGMVLTQGFQQGELTRTLKGRLIYFNPGSSQLNNCLVTLSQGNTIMFQSITGVNGNYFMNNLQTGTYQLNASTGKAWGGVNASDALVIM